MDFNMTEASKSMTLSLGSGGSSFWSLSLRFVWSFRWANIPRPNTVGSYICPVYSCHTHHKVAGASKLCHIPHKLVSCIAQLFASVPVGLLKLQRLFFFVKC